MAVPTHISTTSAHGGSATASIAVPADATNGRELILTVISSGQAAFTPPSEFTLVEYVTWFFGGRDIRVYSKVAGASESGTYDTTIPFSNWSVSLTVLDGNDGTTPVNDSVSTSTDNATSFPTGSVTTTVADCLLVAIWAGAFSANALTIDATFTSRLAYQPAEEWIYVGTKSAAATGSYSATGTTAASDYYGAILIAVAPGAAPATAIPRGLTIVQSQPFAALEI